MANWWLRLISLTWMSSQFLSLGASATAFTILGPDRASPTSDLPPSLDLTFSIVLTDSTSQQGQLADRTTQTNQPDEPTSQPIRPRTDCPSSLQRLMPALLRDLPSYANRVSQRAYTDHRTTEVPGYVLIAGRPEYEPLPLASNSFTSTQADVQQVFFTTLERQYLSGQAFRLQHYHWLFLTQTQNGWRFVLMLSSIGNAANSTTADEPPTPPQDSSQGVIAQAVRLWLQDCEAGFIAP